MVIGGPLIWTWFELCLQQNLHESTISQQRTSRNNSMNFASQRPLLAKVVHVIGIPQRLYIVHSLQALCTTCVNYLLHSRTCTALKSSQEHLEYGIINSHQRPITACRVLVRMDFGRLCVCCVCAVHTAWTWTYQWAIVYMYCKDTRHHVVCASCFQLIVRVFWNERQQFRSRSRQN